MKALFIWRKVSEVFIKRNINKNKQFGEGQYFLTSQDAYNNAFVSLENKINLESYTKIYILAELSWDKKKQFEGYEKGFDIIEKWKGDKPPCIYFFSLANRKVIYNLVDERFKFIVKAFPFKDVLDITNKFKFPTDEISNSKWNFFKTYALKSYGILDVISHRLDGLNERNTDFNKDLVSVINELKSYTKFTGNSIQEFISNVQFNNSFVYDLKFLIENRIEELTGEIKTKKFELPTNLKIVVVEDNDEDARITLNGIKRHYKKEALFNEMVTCFSNGEDALNYIKNDFNNVDIIISDLQLLDKDEFYQKVQGVEIFDEAKNLTSTVVGIITGFGKKGVSKLLEHNDKFILLKKHLKRFNANEEIDNLLKNLYLEYQNKISSEYYSAGPNLGWMSNDAYRKFYSDKKNENIKIHTDNYDKAKKFAKLFIEGKLHLDTVGWDSELLKTKSTKNAQLNNVFNKHYSFLTQRLIVLSFYIKYDKVYDQLRFQSESKGFNKRENLNKPYLTSFLGFSTHRYSSVNKLRVADEIIKEGKYEGRGCDEIRIINLTNLFPEEREWITELGFNEHISIQSQSKECAGWLNDNFNQFSPNIDFGDLSFDEFFDYLLELEVKLIENEISENLFIEIMQSSLTKKIDQYLTKNEKRIIKKLESIYDNLE